jgi:hypothetical protein
VSVAADRGWQSAGVQLQAGKTYSISASGQFTVAGGEKPWSCEAGGVTIRYHNGRPLGMLLGAVRGDNGQSSPAPLAAGQPIGLTGRFTPEESGTLYLSINEASSGLNDNRGALSISIQAE